MSIGKQRDFTVKPVREATRWDSIDAPSPVTPAPTTASPRPSTIPEKYKQAVDAQKTQAQIIGQVLGNVSQEVATEVLRRVSLDDFYSPSDRVTTLPYTYHLEQVQKGKKF
jgi:hypothetical protein